MIKNLPSISVVLYKSKTLANGEHPIMLRVCYNAKRKYISMGISCRVAEWSETKQKVKGIKGNVLNPIIARKLNEANEYVLSIEGKEDYSASTIVKFLSKKTPTFHTLFSLFEERISFFRNEKQKHNTAVGYRTLLTRIKYYTKEKDLELFEITTSWLQHFEEHLRCHYKDTSIRKFFDCFRALFNYALTKNYVNETPFANFQFSKKLDCRTRKRALTLQEMTMLMRYYHQRYGFLGIENNDVYGETKLKEYWINQKFKPKGTTKLTQLNAEQFSLALFLCSYLFQGLALVDLANLKMRDIRLLEVADRDKFVKDVAEHGIDYANSHVRKILYYDINIRRMKTNHDTRIVVEAQNLMSYLNPFNSYFEEYCQLDDADKERYVFPIFDHYNDAPDKKFSRMTYVNYMVNVNLKRIAKRLGLSEDITFYSARHSYASSLYHANVPVGLIAQNMGRNAAEIETYLKEFDVENILKANSRSLVVGQEEFKQIRAAKEKERTDNIRKELQEKGNVEALERYEAFLRWKEEH